MWKLSLTRTPDIYRPPKSGFLLALTRIPDISDQGVISRGYLQAGVIPVHPFWPNDLDSDQI